MNTRIDMMKTVAVLTFAVNVGSAAAVDFPSAGGNLADPSAWGGTLPSSSDDVTIKYAGTYTASGDVSFKTVTADGGGTAESPASMIFDFTSNNAKVTLTGGSSVWGLAYPGYGRHVTMKGGIWDFGNAYLLNGNKGGNASNIGMIITDGVTVTNVYDFMWAKHAKGRPYSCTITGGAKVYVNKDMYNYATGNDAQLFINGGANVAVGGVFYTDRDGTADASTGRHTVTVTGGGTVLELNGSGKNYIGHTHRGNIVTIGDHARFVATSAPTWIGCAATAISNSLVITGGASADMGTTYVGRYNGTWGNRYVVQDGAHATNAYLCVGGENSSNDRAITKNELVVDNAELYVHGWAAIGKPGQNNRATIKSGGVFLPSDLCVGDSVYSVSNLFEALEGSCTRVRNNVYVGVGDSWNELVVSNATSFTANNITLGGAGKHHSTVRVYGPNTDFAFSGISGDWDIFGACRDCLAEFRDGATFDVSKTYLRLGSDSTNCTLRIACGSYLYATNFTSSIGRNNHAAISNRLEVLDESCAKVVRWRMTSEDCCTVLSNSTFETTHPDGFEIGYRESSGGGQTSVMTGNRFEMQGDHPKVKTPGQFTLRNRSTLHLQVPAEGYEKNYALVESDTFSLYDADSRITVDMDEYVAKRGGRIVVAQTMNGVTLNATALSASNALLPERCSFETSADGKTLYLKVPSKDGMVIFYR